MKKIQKKVFLKKDNNFNYSFNCSDFKLLIFSFGFVFIDLISKWFFQSFDFESSGFVYLKFVRNYGSSFSLFSSVEFYRYFVIVLSLIFLIVMIFKRRELIGKMRINFWIFVLIFSGIFGNLFDRIFFGYVRDFIGLKYLFVFNFADVYITLGAALLIYLELFIVKSENKSLKG